MTADVGTGYYASKMLSRDTVGYYDRASGTLILQTLMYRHGYPDLMLSVGHFSGVGDYPLGAAGSAQYSPSSYLDTLYQASAGSNSVLHVESFNQATGEIMGTFQFDAVSNLRPDSIQIRNGKFAAHILVF